MKNKALIYSLYCLSLLIYAGTFTACEDDDDLGTPDRLFRPIIQEVTYGGDWVRAEWKKYENVENFHLEISADSFESIAADALTDTTFYTFENLEYDTEYYLRIKAVGADLESDYFVNERIKTSDYPTQLEPVANIIDTKVRVAWTEAVYDSLVVSRNDTLVTSVELSEADNANKQVVISELTPETGYIVRAYTGGKYMGKQGFSTHAAQIFDGEVFDLRDYSSEEAYFMLTQELFDEFAVNYPDGVTVILEGGTEYELDGGRMSSSVSFVTGLSLDGNAIIRVKGNFDFPESGDASVGKYSFTNITFTDHPDKFQDYGSTYVFNFGTPGHVDSLLFDGCEIRYKRGVVRIKTAASVGVFSMNNCIVDSIGGYGVFNLDNGAAGANEIKFTNSTITHVEGYIVRASKTDIQPRSLLFENVTTCFAPEGGRYFFDMDKKTFDEGIEINNCFFGKGWGDDVTVRGLRSASSAVSYSKSYKTSDLVWDVNAETMEVQYPMELSDLGEDIYAVFEDPDNNNYRVINNTVKNSAGDPRWW